MSVESREEISSIWRTLEKRSADPLQNLDVYETRTRVSNGPALLGLDRQGNRHVLVPVASDAAIQTDRSSGGVHLVTRVANDGVQDRRYLDIVCVKPHLEDVFSVFAGELLEELASEDGDEPLAARTRRVLEDWRELFGRDRGGQLGRSALAGLFGELLQLEKICDISPGGLETWKGPSGDRLDFRAAGCALEVKSTLRQQGRIVEVHGQRQLQVPDDSDLYLAFVKLEQVEAGTSVPELVRRVRNSGVDRAELMTRLSEAGYDLDDEERYEEYRFDVSEMLIFRVDEQFPRILPKSFHEGKVPPGVLSISYTIDLTGPEPTPIEESDRSSVYERLAGGGPS